MPADPKLDELRLLVTLRNEDMPLTCDGWRCLTNLLILACYDRKVEREFFAEFMDLASTCQSALETIEQTMKMERILVLVNPDLPSAKLAEVGRAALSAFIGSRRVLADKFERVCQCPTLADKVS